MIGIFSRLNGYALGRANRRTEITGNAFSLVMGYIKSMKPAKIRRHIRPLIGILQSDRFFEQVHESYFQTLQQW